MKIAVLGATLYASVMAVLLSEYGNNVVWLDHDEIEDYDVEQRFLKQQNNGGVVLADNINHLRAVDIVLLCYSPTQITVAKSRLAELMSLNSFGSPLMINGSTFGLNGTECLREVSPEMDWVYLPDVIQEGNAIQSFLNAHRMIVGFDSERSQKIIQELLRPFFQSQQYLFMPILDAELAKLSISGMLATRISYMLSLIHI